MAIRSRNKRSTEFSSASMSDLVFLLLIFFILISTLVSPNAIKLLLPNSNSKTMAKQNLTVYIDEQNHYFVDQTWVEEAYLSDEIASQLGGNKESTIVLRADKTVAVQYIVNVMDVINKMNESLGTSHKLILATAPKQ